MTSVTRAQNVGKSIPRHRDIGERQQLIRELREKNLELQDAILAKDRFLANMSHELRTPLNAVIGFTGVMLMGLAGTLNEEQEHQLRIIKSSANHLLSLINDLLDLAKIDAGNMNLHIADVSCSELFDEVTTTLAPLANDKGLELSFAIPSPGMTACADRRALRQVLINLVSNAIKFTQTGQVRLFARDGCSESDTSVELCVSDTGMGISETDQTVLFQAFAQLGQDNDMPLGTGLGLYLSRRMVRSMNGDLTLSSHMGKGSTFIVTLPIANRPSFLPC